MGVCSLSPSGERYAGLPVYRLAAVERGWHTPPLPTLSPEGERTLGRFPPPSRPFSPSNPFFPCLHSPAMDFVHAPLGPVPTDVWPAPARHPPPSSPHPLVRPHVLTLVL